MPIPSAEDYRKQAQICTELASISSDPSGVERYKAMAREHLARAVELGDDSGDAAATVPPQG